jgi:phosphatidylserine/phosphatidylglycerophosphate/cardiolipin synthase-like enzyme
MIESLLYMFDQDRKGESIDMEYIHPRLVICPLDCRQVIEEMIVSAEESIDIMTQYIYDDSLIRLLKNTDPDIRLRLLLSDSSGNQSLVDYFGDEIAQMYESSSRYLHTKTILIDDKRLLVGSMNLSQNSLDNNRELGIIITDDEQIEIFTT